MDNVGKYYSFNDKIKNLEQFNDICFSQYSIVYEVIRIIDGKPLFFESHIKRLLHSLRDVKLKISTDKLKQMIEKVVELNGNLNCNVKIMVLIKSEFLDICIYISKSYYPNKEEMTKGIDTDLVYWDRRNPNVKMLNLSYKEMINKVIKRNNLFEVLLVNKNNIITEGSRSNVFFVKQGKVFTTPGNLVLKGITREYIIKACQMINIEVLEEFVKVDEISTIEGAFISGTSIKVLPIRKIGNYRFESGNNSVICDIKNKFDKIIYDYIKIN